MSLKNKLNRYKSHLALNTEKADPVVEAVNQSAEIEIPYLKEWQEFDTHPYFYDGSYTLVREKFFPLDQLHGLYQFSELREVLDAWKQTSNDHPLSPGNRMVQDLVFFDTETTGLSGGVGNTIFLLGMARVMEDHVLLRQYFLPEPGSEVPLYQKFLTDVKDLGNLVTYNGKAFDWPQVKTRHTLIRDRVPNLPNFGHFDLLHASRRLWKKDLESVRLAIVEEEVLQIKRTGDVPGFLAPMLYFDFIKAKNPVGIKGIIEHNETDILSLICLYIHHSKIILNLTERSNREQFEVARWFATLGNEDIALQDYEYFLSRSCDISYDAKKELATIYKRRKQYEKAMKLWNQLLTEKQDPEVAIELAKVYEHQVKDYEKALIYTELAFSISETIDIKKRMNRLENKCG